MKGRREKFSTYKTGEAKIKAELVPESLPYMSPGTRIVSIILRDDLDEEHPPSACFSVRSIADAEEPFPGCCVTEIEVSVYQPQELLKCAWKLLPPEKRPCP